MTVGTMAFTADDAALAVDQLIETATADLDYTSRQQYDADHLRISTEVRAKVKSLISLHGINAFGDPDCGDEAAAAAIIRETEKYNQDPDAYIDQIVPAPEADVQPDTSTSAASVAPAADPLVTPVEAFELAPPAAVAAVEPEAKITFVDRPARTLFPGIGSSYATELIPTVRWESPKPHIPARDPHYAFDGHAVKIMTSAIRRRKNVMAVGDPGCGKTEFFKQFGYAIGLPVHKIPFDGSLTRPDLIGSFRQIATPTGSATPFVLGLIPTLIQRPCIIILDEIDQADPDIQYMLHSLYEGEGLTIQEDGGRYIPRHKDCYIVATANTKGRGSDNGLTNAKFEMSEATRDRFPYWLNFTYLPEDKESATITAKTGLDKALAEKLVGVATSIRNGYKTGSLSQPCSLRQLLDVAEITEDFLCRGPEVALALASDVVLVGRANQDDANAISGYILASAGVDLATLER